MPKVPRLAGVDQLSIASASDQAWPRPSERSLSVDCGEIVHSRAVRASGRSLARTRLPRGAGRSRGGAGGLAALALLADDRKRNAAFGLLSRRGLERPCEALVAWARKA